MQIQTTKSINAGVRGTVLATMHDAKLPISPGFIISADAFTLFCEHNDIISVIQELLPESEKHTEARLKEVAKIIRKLIKEGEFPEDLVRQILTPYLKIGEPRVMLSPSHHEESLPDGTLKDGIYGVEGDANLFSGIRELWGFYFHHRLLIHRQKFERLHFPLPFAIAVQAEPLGKVSAVIFTDDPTAETKQTVLIKAVYGEGALSEDLDGADYYWVKRGTGEIYTEVTDVQRTQVWFEQGKEHTRKTAVSFQQKRKLSRMQIVQLAKLSKDIQQHFFYPQRIVVTITDDKMTLIDSAPMRSEHETKTHLTTQPPVIEKEPTRQTLAIGLRATLNPAGLLPHTSVIHGHLLLSPDLILTRYGGSLTTPRQKLLEHELTHAIDFLLKHTQSSAGIIFDFGNAVEAHDQVMAGLGSLRHIHQTYPHVPLTLLAPTNSDTEYAQWLRYWRQSGLSRGSHVHFSLKIRTPAPMYMLDQFVHLGLDSVCVDLDAIDLALHGTLSNAKQIEWSNALVSFVKESIERCEQHGLICMLTSTRLIDRDMLRFIPSSLPMEWITPSSHYSHLDHAFGE